MKPISAIVMAAGQSKRMGKPKMLLPWGKGTVIEASVNALRQGGIEDVVVVCGALFSEIEAVLGATARCVYNPQYQNDEMLLSLQVGLKSLQGHSAAVLVCLGDHPQLNPQVVTALAEKWPDTRSTILIPSHSMRRGHPWLFDTSLVDPILALRSPATLRDIFSLPGAKVAYLPADASVLMDLDTPQEYERDKPNR